jgi:gas vesicle protein
MATLKSVSELIKKNDENIISELEGQSKSLNDINRGIQKFLGVNERKRLDDLEDRRERRSKVGGLGILAGGAAGAGLAGAAGGGLLEKIIGGVVGSVLAALGIGAIRTTKRLLDALSKDSSNLRSDNKDLKNRIKDLERQAKTDAKSLQDQKKAFDTETKRLQSEIRSVQKELKSERAVNGDRIKQLEGRISTLQSQLDTLRAARTDLVTEQVKLANQAETLKALRSDLSKAESSRFAQRQKIMNVSKELRLQEAERAAAAGQAEVGKFRRMASAMQFQKELHGGFTKGQKLIYRAGNGNISIVEVKGPALDGSGRMILEMQTPNGGKLTFVGVPDRILGEASPEDMRNLKQAKRLGVQPDVKMADVTAPKTSVFSKFMRGMNFMDPVGLAEEASRGGAAVSRSVGATGTAARLTGLARFLGGGVGVAISIGLTPSETGGRINTPSGAVLFTGEYAGGMEANMIMQFLGYLRGSGGSALKQMMDLRKALRENATKSPEQFEMGLMAVFGKMNPDTGIIEIDGAGQESLAQFLSLLNMNDSEFGMFLKQYYGNIKTGYDEAVNAAKRRYMSKIAPSMGTNKLAPAQIAQYQIDLMKAGGRYLQSRGMNKTMIPTAEAMAEINELAAGSINGTGSGAPVNIDASQNSNVVTNQNMGLVIDKSTPAIDGLNGGISRYNPAGYASPL